MPTKGIILSIHTWLKSPPSVGSMINMSENHLDQRWQGSNLIEDIMEFPWNAILPQHPSNSIGKSTLSN